MVLKYPWGSEGDLNVMTTTATTTTTRATVLPTHTDALDLQAVDGVKLVMELI